MLPRCSAAILLLACATPLAADWKIPDPSTTQHPGAAEAPASDPRTYPDAAGFEQRVKLLIEGLKTRDLQDWRKGWFAAGGDPGKYIPGPSMAKLIADPKAADAIALQNEPRSLKEQYHFATVNWGRFLPLFGDILTPESRKIIDGAVANTGFLGVPGTENHKMMWLGSANVLPWYTESGRLQKMSKEAGLKRAKQELRKYVKGLYLAGQGEWDSSTYLMFDVNAMLNVYDFARDEEARLLAKAALDWYMAGYALKYTDGVYCSPNQRGYAAAPGQTITDATGWLWWASRAKFTPEQTRNFLYAMHAATSAWRPNRVLCSIANRKLPQLPFEARNTKANYWYGQGLDPQPGVYHESVYVARHFTMGSLWDGFGGQITRFQIVAATDEGGVTFTGGYPAHWDHTVTRTGGISYADGNGGFDQTALIGSTYVCLTRIPPGEAIDYSFFRFPASSPPQQHGKWLIMQAGKTLIGLYPLGGEAKVGDSDLSDKQKADNEKAVAAGKPARHKPFPILRLRRDERGGTGFVLQLADTEQFADVRQFAGALAAKVKIDPADGQVQVADLLGRKIQVKHQEWAKVAAASVDGKPLDFTGWSVWGAPYVQADKGVLAVNDGTEGFVVDFTGELPVYKPWRK